MRPRSYWGWGYEDAALEPERRRQLALLVGTQIDASQLAALAPRPLDAVALPPPRVAAPAALAPILRFDARERAGHTYGKAYRDVVRALRGEFEPAPDAVALPRSDAEVAAVLEWCSENGYAAIPYGGGSSVVGGVEARCKADFPAAVSIDLRRLAGLIEVDASSRAALIAAGTYGPAIEDALKPHGMTLRHYPQSFELSTLGGWLATRAGGHFATLHTHIDDLTESLTAITPRGTIETRRLPASGAGPAPERLLLGSEGAFGIITRAWMRVVPRPTFRASSTVRFADFYAGARAARALAQSGLYPANCRLLDARETLLNGVGDGSASFLLVAFESADHPLDAWLERALELCREHGGVPGGGEAAPRLDLADGAGDDASARWRRMFLRAPYLRDALIELGVVVETFETAVLWRDFEALHRSLLETAQRAAGAVCGSALVTSRITHVYPDGAAPYFTVIAPGRAGSHVSQWDEIKAAVSDAIVAGGATITHHHAVGRDHRPWYQEERAALFGASLRAVKAELDPAGVLNPGVLI
jgi:alkyldihydroxyacetonephosphate synthase